MKVKNNLLVIIMLLTGVGLLQGCAMKTSSPSQVKKQVNLANPADVYCLKVGGTLQSKQNAAGQYSICILPNGKQIESWRLFRDAHPKENNDNLARSAFPHIVA